ncbi:hypothetical protein NDU88_008873 [Pleurodeles waltl]|uniref:Uncharacterized protein n=1 Tax=Pleurodeles waltl TaxID=8319 RepID=A0AAV7RTP7_PLEWA|nr:hypothetical protein NDU88_008873 [Pleurodeles waltl]
MPTPSVPRGQESLLISGSTRAQCIFQASPAPQSGRSTRAPPPSHAGRPPGSERGPRLHPGPRLLLNGRAAGLRQRRVARLCRKSAPGLRPRPSGSARSRRSPHPHPDEGLPGLARPTQRLLSAPPELND